MSGASSLRDPVTLPKCMDDRNKQLAKVGVGRGRGLLGATVQQNLPGVPTNSLVSSAPARPQQRYIPGLNTPPHAAPAGPVSPGSDEVLPKIPPELVTQYKHEEKNPISCLMEYGAVTKVKVSFQECSVDGYSGDKFANVCIVNGRQFPQGEGRTKKLAKTMAAKLALHFIIEETAHLPDEPQPTGKPAHQLDPLSSFIHAYESC